MVGEFCVWRAGTLKQKTYILPDGFTGPWDDAADYASCGSVLVQVFAAVADRQRVLPILQSLAEAFPRAAIIGASTDEAIAEGRVIGGGRVVVSVAGFHSTTVHVACEAGNGDSTKLGRKLAAQLNPDRARAVITFASADGINGEAFLAGMAQGHPDLILAGGMASSTNFQNTFVICRDRILEHGVVGVSLSGHDLHVHRASHFGWKPVGREMLATEAKGNRLLQIDGLPAKTILARYLGRKIVDGFPELGSAFPLLVKREGDLVARGIIAMDGDTVIVSGNLRTGDRLHIGYGNTLAIARNNRLVDGVLDQFGEPDVAFAYSCVGRKFYLPRSVTECEVEAIGRLPGGCGFFTLGEFYTGSAPAHLNFSSTILALKEGDPVRSPQPNRQEQRMPELDPVLAIADGLFHFIDVRTAELDHMAYHDSLTGLPNALLFRDRLEHACLRAPRVQGRHALLFLDLDGFKTVNDTLGHRAGDVLLQIISNRLQAELRAEDTVARIAGDEFAILIENAESDMRAAQVAEKLIDCVARPITLEEQEVTVTVSVGIAMAPDDGPDPDTLLRNADAAMYRAKSRGRNGFSFYRKALTDEATEKFRIKNDLRVALDRGDFLLHYQPQIDMLSGHLTGAEALVRWNHPEKGLIQPGAFIAIAEESGLVARISSWVLAEACRQIGEWHSDGFLLPRLSLNASPAEFVRGSFARTVASALKQHGILPEFLEIEITESVLLSENNRDLAALHRMGLRVAIDDFGTGYSSFAYLGRLAVDRLKIDRSFLRNVPGDARNQAIVRAILLVAREFGIPTVAEGVETKEQEDFLRSEGCSGAQGYLYGRPMAASAFRAAFADRL